MAQRLARKDASHALNRIQPLDLRRHRHQREAAVLSDACDRASDRRGANWNEGHAQYERARWSGHEGLRTDQRVARDGAEACRARDNREGRHGKGDVCRKLARPRNVAFALRLCDAARRWFEGLLRAVAHFTMPGTPSIGGGTRPAANGTTSAVAIKAAANASGKASVNVPKRGTTRESVPSAI